MREFHRATGWHIDADRRVLRVDWEDGAATEYGFEELRRACPCAMCAGEGGFRGTMSAATPLSDKLTTLESVKAYYGRVLQSSSDLQTSACCPTEAMPPAVRAIAAEVHPEIIERFYGCDEAPDDPT